MIVATAGHVDHGKTSLIKQLTGVETDRLEEEKRRGLSINLGFAYSPLSNGNVLGFIDVPGHSRFINTMIAGVSGIDIGMLVVAADDGPMPQTLEHLDVLRLLGVENYILVITKIDRSEQERIAEITEQMQHLLGKEVPVFAVDNISAKGIDKLQAYLDSAAQKHQQKNSKGHFRMSVDRVFTIKGTGLIVTGTVISGEVAIGDKLLLQPHGEQVRVRGIHAQDQRTERGRSGQRCAINIAGNIERTAINRGNMLVSEKLTDLTKRCDVRLNLLPSVTFSLKHLSPVKIHIGAGHYAARIYFIEQHRTLEPGTSTMAQLLFEEPISVCHGDRFILRDDSESVSVGGGVILDPVAVKPGSHRAERIDQLLVMESGNAADTLETLLRNWAITLDFDQYKRSWNIPDSEQDVLLSKKLYLINNTILSQSNWAQYKTKLLGQLKVWHQQNPGIDGVAPGKLKGSLSEKLFVSLLGELVKEGAILLRGGLLSLPQHQTTQSPEQQRQWSKIEQAYESSEFHMPTVSEVEKATAIAKPALVKMLKGATKSGQLHGISDNRFVRSQDLKIVSNKVLELGEGGAGFSVVQYKTAIGCGRNLSIELLEYFDKIRFTQRRGNERTILDSKVPDKLFKE